MASSSAPGSSKRGAAWGRSSAPKAARRRDLRARKPNGCARSSRTCWRRRGARDSPLMKYSARYERSGQMVPVTIGHRSEEVGGGQSPRLNIVAIVILLACIAIGAWRMAVTENPIPLIVMVVIGLVLMQSPRIAQQWERAVILRLGRFVGLRGPGLFWIIPFVDRVSSWIDQRTITTSFAAEQTLTSDTVPVNVDAVLFWMVHDVQKAALEVQDYPQAVSWAAQTALRDIIGRTTLTDLLRGRERIEDELQQLIDQRSNPWGVTVSSVEMRDIVIPGALQDAMS